MYVLDNTDLKKHKFDTKFIILCLIILATFETSNMAAVRGKCIALRKDREEMFNTGGSLIRVASRLGKSEPFPQDMMVY